ncbi:unnamed protein product [Calypogeia fissa]
MGIPSHAEELAWLVRDNLHAKHLVLSVEELFVEFLECPLGEEGTLALEPMESYQRMLLHHLADLFGLAHESVGEGEERHLVVEKCEDSSIPAVLVSDLLLNDDRGTQLPLLSRQLLKRNTTPTDGSQTPAASSTSTMSLEEREAAYLAARQRIFSGTWKYAEETPKSTGIVRPRSDPVVARRMIAHALGKSRVLDLNSPATDLTSSEDLHVESVDGVSAETREDSLGNEESIISTELKESMQQASAKAAKRLFANALSSSYATTSPRVNLLHVSCKTGTSIIPSDPGEDTSLDSVVPSSKNLTSISRDSDDTAHQGRPHSSETNSSMKPRKGTRDARPGGAACRIFAQALGLPDPACATDINRPASNPQRSSIGNGCKSWQR